MRLVLVLMILPYLAWASPQRNDKPTVITAEVSAPLNQPNQMLKPYDINDYYRADPTPSPVNPAPANGQQQQTPQGPNFMFNTGFSNGM